MAQQQQPSSSKDVSVDRIVVTPDPPTWCACFWTESKESSTTEELVQSGTDPTTTNPTESSSPEEIFPSIQIPPEELAQSRQSDASQSGMYVFFRKICSYCHKPRKPDVTTESSTDPSELSTSPKEDVELGNLDCVQKEPSRVATDGADAAAGTSESAL